MEGTLEAAKALPTDAGLEGFNPSIHGRYFGRLLTTFFFISPLRVSIHLFMEGTLEVGLRIRGTAYQDWFQSIYSWKVLWKCTIGNNYVAFVGMFQSIYSWKVLWKMYIITFILGIEGVSIHLFMEGTLEAYFPPTFGENQRFQSIYSWKVLWKPVCQSVYNICE